MLDPLKDGFDPLDVGTGLVQAPQNLNDFHFLPLLGGIGMSNDKEGQGKSPIDENLLELLENRISKKVAENVEKGLRWRYGLVAAAIVGIIGFFGWSVKTSIDAQIGLIASTAKENLDKEIDDLQKEAEDTIKDARISLGVTTDQQRRTNALMDQIEKSLGEFQNKLQILEPLAEKVQNLEAQRRDIEVRLEAAGLGVITLQGTAQKLTELASQVEKLSEIISMQAPEATQITSSVQTIIEKSQETAEAAKKAAERTTVFLQFSGPPRSQAQAISQSLSNRGYAIPGEDRQEMAGGLREVRYFHEADRPAAERLVTDTETVLAELGYGELKVKPQPLTTWAGKKPRPGVLELWLSIPRLPGS
jgi:hypothetical protein